MSEVRITVSEDGPYVISGPVSLQRPGGVEIEQIGARLFLCRCGGSADKPFCDGTHSKIGFREAVGEPI